MPRIVRTVRHAVAVIPGRMPHAASTSTSGNGQWKLRVDQSHRTVLTSTCRHADLDVTLGDEEGRGERSPSRRSACTATHLV